MKWLATEVVEVAVDMAVAVEVEVDAEAAEDSPAPTLRLWVEIVVGKLFILLHSYLWRFDNCRFAYLGVLWRAYAFHQTGNRLWYVH